MQLLKSVNLVRSLCRNPYSQYQNMSNLSNAFVAKEYPLVADFLTYVNRSPSPFHCVKETADQLRSAGYTLISEKNDADFKNIKPFGKYYFTRNQSTIFAFVVGGKWKPGNGFSITAAHTDSPVLRVKPVSNIKSEGYLQVGVEVYGGGIWHTWFDRELSLAGRVVIKEPNGTFVSRLVCIDRPILRIPNIAIHLNRDLYEKGFNANRETHTVPILATCVKEELMKRSEIEGGDEPKAKKAKLNGDKDKEGDEAKKELHHPLLLRVLAHEMNVSEGQIKDFELSLFDTQPAGLCGVYNEFICSPRLDNLMMSFCSLQSLLASSDQESLEKEENIRMIALFDNEEVGSSSNRGAASNMMLTTLTRISQGQQHIDSSIQKSMLISADMAHALHPNYSDKHEKNHRPAMHKGLVIKCNQNQRYATTNVTSFIVKEIAERHGIPTQDFVVRNDVGCGSTIGPILSSNCGIRTVDVGAPQLAMHSVREMCGTEDVLHSTSLITAFLKEFSTLDKKVIVD